MINRHSLVESSRACRPGARGLLRYPLAVARVVVPLPGRTDGGGRWRLKNTAESLCATDRQRTVYNRDRRIYTYISVYIECQCICYVSKIEINVNIATRRGERRPLSQENPGSDPGDVVSNRGQVCSPHIAPVHSAVYTSSTVVDFCVRIILAHSSQPVGSS